MAIPDLLLQIVYRFWDIFSAPIKNPDMLWIMIPIYINWIFIDYLLERKGTGFGSAITNGVVQLWVGVDWMRQATKNFSISVAFATKAVICLLSVIWGLIIMVEGARARPITRYIGRIREISYFMIVSTPIFYGVISVDWTTIGAVLLFFPIFYGMGEVVNRLLPTPPGEEESFGSLNKGKDIGMSDLGGPMPDIGAGFPPAGMPPTGMQQQNYPPQGYGQNYGQQGYPPQMPRF